MKIQINDAQQMGKVLRATRKSQGLRQDDAAGTIGVSENFMSKVERGAGAVQWGKMFQIADNLGVRIIVDVPDDVQLPDDFPGLTP